MTQTFYVIDTTFKVGYCLHITTEENDQKTHCCRQVRKKPLEQTLMQVLLSAFLPSAT